MSRVGSPGWRREADSIGGGGLVEHFERRREAMDGKAMIVCMSRRICVELYKELVALRLKWASAPDDDIEAERDKDSVVKIVMTGSASDELDWQQRVRTKRKRKELASRFKDTNDPFRIVIVRDMWLTGFDAPCLHTLYIDKPMRGHELMQAIARVNRVFKDKPGGHVVDYLGLADQLKAALAKRPDISILSDEFLAEVRGLKHKNLAAELLEKLLKGEIKERSRRNVVQSRTFSELLKQILNKYHNRAIATQEIIDELLKLAKQMRDATQRGDELGLNDDEICFYDALAVNESAVQAMGIDELKIIAANSSRAFARV